MPKDEWAATRRRDAIRRGKRDAYLSRRPKKSKAKAKRKQKIRNQSAASKRLHDRKLGNSAPPSRMIDIPLGTAVSIRKWGARDWIAYVTKKAVRAAVTFQGDEYTVARFQNWLVKIPRPAGF